MNNLREKLESLLIRKEIMVEHNKTKDLGKNDKILLNLTDYSDFKIPNRDQLTFDKFTKLVKIKWLYFFKYHEFGEYGEYYQQTLYVLYGITNKEKIITVFIPTEYPNRIFTYLKDCVVTLCMIVYNYEASLLNQMQRRYILNLLELSDSEELNKFAFKIM